MIRKQRLFSILRKPHISEKTSSETKNNNVVTFKVIRNATKKEIQFAIRELFDIHVKSVRTLIIKGKKKYYKKRIGFRSDWKKAYISLRKGQNIDAINQISME